MRNLDMLRRMVLPGTKSSSLSAMVSTGMMRSTSMKVSEGRLTNRHSSVGRVSAHTETQPNQATSRLLVLFSFVVFVFVVFLVVSLLFVFIGAFAAELPPRQRLHPPLPCSSSAPPSGASIWMPASFTGWEKGMRMMSCSSSSLFSTIRGSARRVGGR